MNNFISLFNNLNSKFMDNFNKNVNNLNNISKDEKNYLNIIYKLKKTTLTKFAEFAEVTKPAATQIINKFINKGYVTKNISKEDKRIYYVELTEEIKKHFIEGYKNFNKMINECLSFLTEEEVEQFNNLLLKINENL